MIRQVRGPVLSTGKNFLIMEVGGSGLGLQLFVTEPTLARARSEQALTLHTYLQVRETELSLYGFESQEELGIFELLLTVSGVGPKAALSVLSTLAPDTLRLAVANKEPGLVARAPGIGKRTAEKIVVELKGKLTPGDGDLAQLATSMDTDADVIDALTSLGYSVVEAQRAVQQIPKEVVGVEERLRVALSHFQS